MLVTDEEDSGFSSEEDVADDEDPAKSCMADTLMFPWNALSIAAVLPSLEHGRNLDCSVAVIEDIRCEPTP